MIAGISESGSLTTSRDKTDRGHREVRKPEFLRHPRWGWKSCQCFQQPKSHLRPVSHYNSGRGRHEESPTHGNSSPRSYLMPDFCTKHSGTWGEMKRSLVNLIHFPFYSSLKSPPRIARSFPATKPKPRGAPATPSP